MHNSHLTSSSLLPSKPRKKKVGTALAHVSRMMRRRAARAGELVTSATTPSGAKPEQRESRERGWISGSWLRIKYILVEIERRERDQYIGQQFAVD